MSKDFSVSAKKVHQDSKNPSTEARKSLFHIVYDYERMSKRQVERGRDVMALKRKPPTGNVRRIAPIDNNLRYAITSKDDETVQCESFQERKLT